MKVLFCFSENERILKKVGKSEKNHGFVREYWAFVNCIDQNGFLGHYYYMKYRYIFVIIMVMALCACKTGRQVTEPFTVHHNSPQIPVGEIEVQFDTLLGIGGLKKQTVNVIYYPREDAVCLQYRQDFLTYNQFWSRTGRQAFLGALQQYNEDYDARSLNRNGGRSARRKYGVVEGYLIWQQFSFSVRARANMNVELGYAFKERLPYFLVNQREAEFIDPDSQDNYRVTSTTGMYFTRAQAAELAVFFEQHFLNGLSLPNRPAAGTADIDRDEY